MYANLAAAQSAFLADSDLLGRKRSSLGGSVIRALTMDLHAMTGGACIYCGTETNIYGEGAHPLTATLATLIPCTLIDDDGGIHRAGYVPGNVAIAHVGCVAAANAYGVATGEPVVLTADDVDPALVPLVWPKTRKARSAAEDPDATAALLTARQRLGWTF